MRGGWGRASWAALLLLASGCFSPEKLTVQRTAADQQVTTAAVRSCVEALDLSELPRGPVYSLTVSCPTNADAALVEALLRDRLHAEGHRVAREHQGGQSVLEVVCHYAGSDLESTLIGIPLVIPGLPAGAGDISLYKSTTQTGRARMGYQVWGPSGLLLQTSAGAQSSRYIHNMSFLTFIGDFILSDIEDFREPGDEEDDEEEGDEAEG